MFTSMIRNSAPSSLEDPRLDLNDPKGWDRILGGERSESGVRVTPKVAMAQPAFWRGINILANGVARVPFDVFKNLPDGTKEKDRKHFASQLIRWKANRFMTAFRFKRLLTYHSIFRGNGIAVIERDNAARPVSMVPADPTRFGIVQTPAGDVKYLIGAGKDARLLDYYNVLHIRGLSWDGMMGIDVFELMKEPMGLGVAARKFGAKFFGKGANAGGFLITPTGLSPEAVKRIHSDFKKATSGLDKAFATTLLEDGAKFQQTMIAPEQAQFLATRLFESRELANIIGIQSHKIGDKEGQAYNSLEQENQSFIDDSLDPHLCAWEDEYNDKLLSEQEKRDESFRVEANRKAIKRVDTKTETEDLVTQVNNGLISENESRAIRNLPAYPNGSGNRFRIPSNIMYTDQVGQTQQNQNTKSEVRNLIQDRLARMQEIEATKIKQAAAKKGNFLEWIETFYADHSAKLQESLEPVIRVAKTLWPELTSAEEISESWCEESRLMVVDAAGCSASQLSGSLETMLAGWQDRSQKRINQLIEKGKDNA